MESLKQTATAPIPENTPLDKLVVNEVVKDNKLKIFADLYFWFLGHLIALYVSIAESLGIREPPLESDKKRVRWTCVSLSQNCFFIWNMADRTIYVGLRLPFVRYNDFFELVPGAVEILQRHLDNSDPRFAQSKDVWDQFCSMAAENIHLPQTSQP